MKRSFAIILVTLELFFIATVAFVQGAAVPAEGGSAVPSGPNSLIPRVLTSTTFEDLVKAIAAFLKLVMAPIAVIMILYSAFLFMTSGGSEERVTKAKKTLMWTVVGIAIILIGAGFVSIVKSFLEK